jgi:uncharacterized membrane protein/carbon monoxide dehydrogenase subunit G
MTLAIYLNDHLAGAMAGVALAKRLARTHPALRGLAADVEEDQRELVAIMRTLEVDTQWYKPIVGRLGEKLGRLKLNGRLLRRAPLSDVLELEAMALGITGKRAIWRALQTLEDPRLDAAALDRLEERAEAQFDVVENLRLAVFPSAVRASKPDIEVTRTFTVSRTPDEVADYLRDFAHAEQWDPGTVSCTRIGGGPVEVGARWRNESKFLGRQTELVYELTRDEPDGLRFVGRNKTATTTDDISLTAGEKPGTTRIGYHAHVEFHGLAKLASPVARIALERLGDRTSRSLVRVLS